MYNHFIDLDTQPWFLLKYLIKDVLLIAFNKASDRFYNGCHKLRIVLLTKLMDFAESQLHCLLQDGTTYIQPVFNNLYFLLNSLAYFTQNQRNLTSFQLVFKEISELIIQI